MANRLMHADLVILGEPGYLPQAGGALLFHLLSKLYGRTHVTITTNVSFIEWSNLFGDEKMTALLDHQLKCHGQRRLIDYHSSSVLVVLSRTVAKHRFNRVAGSYMPPNVPQENHKKSASCLGLFCRAMHRFRVLSLIFSHKHKSKAFSAWVRESDIQISCRFSLTLGCIALGTLLSTLAVLCTPTTLVLRRWPMLGNGLPEA